MGVLERKVTAFKLGRDVQMWWQEAPSQFIPGFGGWPVCYQGGQGGGGDPASPLRGALSRTTMGGGPWTNTGKSVRALRPVSNGQMHGGVRATWAASCGEDPAWHLFVCLFVFGLDQGELAHPVHHVVFETTSRNQGSELSGATMIPQITVVADLTRSEDLLSLKPGYAVVQ